MKDNRKIGVVEVKGGFYTAVVIEINVFESKIIDERHFATKEESEIFKQTITKEYTEKNVSCVVSFLG